MKTLIISDVHLGDLRHLPHHDALVFLLTNTDYDRLIINGDFWDLWKVNGEDLHDDFFDIVQLLMQISLEKEVIYIAGNHDDTIRHNMQLVPVRVKVLDKYEFDHSICWRVRVIHGHQYDWTQNWRRVAVSVVRFQNWFDRTFKTNILKWIVTKLGLNPRKWNDALVTGYKAVAENHDVDTLVIGHTHLPGTMKFISGPRLLNCGDFVENLTYLLFEEDTQPKLLSKRGDE